MLNKLKKTQKKLMYKNCLYNQRLIGEPTQYVINRGEYYVEFTSGHYYGELVEYNYTTDVIGKKACWWWLRSPGESSETANDVQYNGSCGWGSWRSYGSVGVRPAMYIEFE